VKQRLDPDEVAERLAQKSGLAPKPAASSADETA